MLKKSIVAFTLIFAFVGAATAADKIGVVDMQAILAGTPQFKSINDKIEKKFKERTDALKAMQKQGEGLQAKMKRDAMTLTGVQKLDMTRQLQALDVDFNLKKKFLEEDLKYTGNQEKAKVMQTINVAIKKVAEKQKIDLVLMKNVTVHVSGKIDITNKVIKILNNPAG